MRKGILSLVSALVVFGATSAYAEGRHESAAQQTISGQIAAFKAQDGAKAFSYAAPNVKRFFPTTDAFMRMVKSGYQPVYNPRQFSFGRYGEKGGSIFQEVLVTGPAGKEWVALYTLEVQADGSLLITSCRLAKHDALSI